MKLRSPYALVAPVPESRDSLVEATVPYISICSSSGYLKSSHLECEGAGKDTRHEHHVLTEDSTVMY